jgi:uracil-DNA glycosylase
MRDDFDATIQKAYIDTMGFFTKLSAEEAYRKYVCPEAMCGEPGFAIFYTPPAAEPELAVIGQNPANFAGRGSWKAEPNKTMLSGTAPSRNSYHEDSHFFAEALGTMFAGHDDLLAHAVGLNVWHFQASSDDAKTAPKDLIAFCEATTRDVVSAMKPKTIICFGRAAFFALTNKRKGHRIPGTVRAEWLDVDGSRVWFIYHPTSSRTRHVASHDAPIVLNDIAAYIGRPKAA